MYCKELGIRLSGLPLGRRKVDDSDEEVKRQMYQDSCERNIVESRNGIAKRRYGMDLIKCKLNETAKTDAALSIIAMNAIHKIAQWLALFFGFEHGICIFQESLLIALWALRDKKLFELLERH